MKKHRFFLILLFVAIFFSCDDDFDNLSKENENGTELKEIVIGGEIYLKFTHNKSGLVEEELNKYHYSRYIYNHSNRLVESEHYWDERIASSSSYVLEETLKRTEWISPENSEMDVYTAYEYDRFGRLKRSITNRLHNNIVSTSDYICYNNGQIKLKTWENDAGPKTSEKYFYDSTGNLIKKERFNGSELQTTTEYEFDDHPNPYYSFRKLMTPGMHTNLNNVVKEIYTLHFEVDDFIDNIQITEYSYEYNSYGFPVKRSDGWEYKYY